MNGVAAKPRQGAGISGCGQRTTESAYDSPGGSATRRRQISHSDEERAHLESIGVGRAVVGERELALAMVRYVFGSYGVREDMAAVAAEMLQLRDPHSGRGGRGGPGVDPAEAGPPAA